MSLLHHNGNRHTIIFDTNQKTTKELVISKFHLKQDIIKKVIVEEKTLY